MASLGDMTYGDDVLYDAHIKPWWESGVLYFNRLLLACGITLVIIVDSKEIECSCMPIIPINEMELRDEFVDKTCYNQSHLWQRYPGAGLLMGGVVTYMVCTWWTGYRDVKKAFYAVAKADKLLEENRILRQEITGMSTRNSTTSERTARIINFAMEYFEDNVKFNGSSLIVIYIIAIAVRLVCFAFAAYMIWHTFFMNPMERFTSFKCNVTYQDVVEEYICASDIGAKGFVAGVAILILALIMLGCTIYGACVAVYSTLFKYGCTVDSCSGTPARDGGNIRFLKMFCRSAVAVSPALVQFMDYAAGQDRGGIQDMAENENTRSPQTVD